MRTHRSAIFLATSWLVLAIAAQAHEGRLDDNGCHYDRANGNYHCHRDPAPNPDRFARIKKSRENICHDAASPSYRTLKYFVAYRDMSACLRSGGRERY